jgi:mRNA interferase HicA
MKHSDLVRALERLGCVLARHGGKHDWYSNPQTGMSQPVPRHREINEMLAKRIIKMLSQATGKSTIAPPDEGEE